MLSPREAIRILMLSPIYWQLKVPQRKELIREYRASFAAAAQKNQS